MKEYGTQDKYIFSNMKIKFPCDIFSSNARKRVSEKCNKKDGCMPIPTLTGLQNSVIEKGVCYFSFYFFIIISVQNQPEIVL